MPALTYLSVCSGIEAASVAWSPLGWLPHAFAEIEPFPSAVLAHHYPGVPNWGDLLRCAEWPHGAAVDLLVGGTPCQSFSVAGLRHGLADPRGNLALTYLAVADRYRPRWVVWENVPGVLSATSHDAPDQRPPDDDVEEGTERVVEDSYDADENHAFACFLAGLSDIGYGFSYRCFDAQYFGLAQRRKRVFVVGYFGDWRRPAAVLFERESLSGHPAPSREAREGITCTPAGIAGSCSRKWSKGTGGPAGDEHYNLVCPPLDASYARLQGTSGQDLNHGHGHLVAPTLPSRASAGGGHGTDFDLDGGLVSAFQESQSGVRVGDAHPTLDSHNGSRRHHGVAQDALVRRLTPRECERLQGFPDDYTLVTYRGKPAADGPRYKALGNSMAVPVMRWIGQRIDLVESR